MFALVAPNMLPGNNVSRSATTLPNGMRGVLLGRDPTGFAPATRAKVGVGLRKVARISRVAYESQITSYAGPETCRAARANL